MNLHTWAARWGISLEAVADLQRQFGLYGDDLPQAANVNNATETGVANAVRIEASKLGLRLWRNNVGALQDVNGRHVRFGLANDSAVVNAKIKSADLIGVRPVVVTQTHVGHTIGQFVSREIKTPGWHYTGTPRELAQMHWAELIAGLGGDAAFTTGEGSL